MTKQSIMKIYFVSAGEVTTYDVIDRESDLKVPEVGFLVELVAAPTRGAATYEVWKAHRYELGDLNEQHWQTKLLGRGGRKRGLLLYSDPFWRSHKLPEPGTLRP